jgi:signal transduction histidine kinase/ActR/RegA family two-component response regulator
MERIDRPSAGGSSSGEPEPGQGRVKTPLPRRAWFSLRMHHLLFIAFTLVAAAPIAVLALWEGRTSFQNELDSVRERHLLVARNLTSTLSRYVKDLKAVFGVAIESGALETPVAGMADLLTSLEVVHVCVLRPDGSVESCMRGLQESEMEPVTAQRFEELRALPKPGSTEAVLSNLYHDAQNNPVFYIVKPLADGRTALGIVRTRYLVSLQQSIAFGDHGHAVITDAKGQVIAHPLKDWVAASRDISGVNVVAAMMRGQTGVDQFYSPAFHDDMIAGYAVVPETGWGVMVPQPIGELRRRASIVNQMATIIAVGSFIAAALLSWLIALYLARPVRVVAATAEAVLDGNDEVSVPSFRGAVPREIRQLGLAFNTMLSDLRRRASETLQALRQAETSNMAKTQFLANMSHEIRTPLNGVVGMIELMRMTELSEAQRGYTEQASQSSQTLLRLIDDILDLSRIEAGRLELETAPFHLPTLLQDLRVLFAGQARAKGLTLSVSVPGHLNVMLMGDKHRLLQVLVNLVGNAVKFTQQGSVSVGVSRSALTEGWATLRFEVADTGIGVPKDKQDMIFEAFSQADASMTRRYGGTGLGLSIVRQLCQMMGGDIGVTSSVGSGSMFWFTVRVEIGTAIAPAPAAPPTQVAAATVPEPKLAPAEGGVSAVAREFQAALRAAGRAAVRILLVEDNAANMRVTKALLEILGCTVTPADNGLVAVEEYRNGTFDLVLMDCQMPEMDGYEATRTIRQLETAQGRRTTIVALTAHAMAGSREASLAAGMDDQLTKPLTMAALTAKLVEWLVDTRSAQPAA